ncbi:MAG: hypothetical protein AB7T17_00950 [Geobacter sp.]|jgi:hypothetical protein|nr:hypothetical protein [Candidatus Cloacimonadota bacterium]
MELFVVCIVGVVVAALLFREFGGKRNTTSVISSHDAESASLANTFPHDWMTDPAYFWMMGNIYYSRHQGQVDECDAINNLQPLSS